jgi:hypothetical protein
MIRDVDILIFVDISFDKCLVSFSENRLPKFS